jgi:hypothetical protein
VSVIRCTEQLDGDAPNIEGRAAPRSYQIREVHSHDVLHRFFLYLKLRKKTRNSIIEDARA